MKCKSLCLAVIILLITAVMPTSAETTNYINGEGKINLTDYVQKNDAVEVSESNVLLEGEGSISYAVTVAKEGWYKFSAAAKASEDKTIVKISMGENSHEGSVDKTARDCAFGSFYLSESENIVEFAVGKNKSAEISKITVKYIEHDVSDENYTVVKAGDYLSTTVSEGDFVNNQTYYATGDYGHGVIYGCVVTSSGNTEYVLNVKKTGIYKMTLYASSSEASKMELSLNDDVISKANVALSSDIIPSEFGKFMLPEGKCTVTVKDTSGSGYRFNYYYLIEYVSGNISLENISANGTVITEGENVARSSDTFEFNYTAECSEADFKPILKADGAEVKGYSYTEGNKGYFILNESLETDKEYTLSVGKVKDAYGFFEADEASITFKTEETGTGSASAEIISAKEENGKFTAEGMMKSSKGTYISGRRADLYIRDTNGNISDEAVCSVNSDKDGKFILEYTLEENAADGIYTLIVTGEYVATAAEQKVQYISSTLETKILEEMENAETYADVKTVIETYAARLGINPSEDLKDISNKDAVYERIANEDYASVKELIAKYHAFSVIESAVQQRNTTKLFRLLSNEEKMAYVGVNANKIALVKKLKGDMITEIYQLLQSETIEDENKFADLCNTAAEKWLAEEYNKENIILECADISGDEGQELCLDIKADKEYEMPSKLVLKIKSNEESLLKGAVCTAADGSKLELDGAKGEYTVEYVPSSDNRTIEDIASIKFVGKNDGKYTVEVSGMAEFELNSEVSVSTEVQKAVVNISINKNSKKGQTSGGGGGNKGTSSTPVIPVNPGTSVTLPQESEKFVFEDISDVEWARESIEKLTERNIISKSEDKKFNPNTEITRAEFAKMIVEALQLKTFGNGVTFNDTEKDAWYYSYASAAAENGLVTGDDKGNFNADSKITREDAAVIIFRVLKKLDFAAEKSEVLFEDNANISDYAEDAVYTMLKTGIMNGVGGNRFAPKDGLTRAMGAKIIFEMMKAVGI